MADEPRSSEAFIPVTLAATPIVAEPECIELDLQRGALSVRVRWPTSGAASCATWLREVLRA